jgi:hypothetical protein
MDVTVIPSLSIFSKAVKVEISWRRGKLVIRG